MASTSKTGLTCFGAWGDDPFGGDRSAAPLKLGIKQTSLFLTVKRAADGKDNREAQRGSQPTNPAFRSTAAEERGVTAYVFST
jgi:hypothetical protein